MNPQDRIHSPQDEDRLLQYLDSQLPAPEARAIEAHLAVCPDCQALRHQWEQLDQQLARTLAQPRLSPDFAARLRQRVAVDGKAGAPGARVRESAGDAAKSHQPWIEDRRRGKNMLWLGLLDGFGYGVAAAVGGYCLFRLAVAWIPDSAGTGTAFLSGPAFLFGMAIAGVTLLFGLNLASGNKVLRWVGAYK
jgi:anti-sigma factor RsiW